MIKWDQILVQRCKSLGLIFDLHLRYVDDMIIIMKAVGKGWYYDEKDRRLKFDSELQMVDTLSSTECIARIIAQISDTIDTNIQVTIDTPERNSDRRLPVLDLKYGWMIIT